MQLGHLSLSDCCCGACSDASAKGQLVALLDGTSRVFGDTHVERLL